MTWLWFAHCAQAPPPGTCARAATSAVTGEPAGFLAAWPADHERPTGAAKIDARAVDERGATRWVSLVLADAQQTLPFDDPMIAGALRRVLALPPAVVFSTLALGDDRWVGSLTGCHERDERLDGDPFAGILASRLLRVEAGFLGRTPALPGPVIERYGGDQPWPWDRFECGVNR